MDEDKEKIKEKIEVGEYSIFRHDDDSVWIAHVSGEALTMWNWELEGLLKEYFTLNF